MQRDFKPGITAVVAAPAKQYIPAGEARDNPMKETQRIAYLRQMGYQQYYSRFVLPGAKASVIDLAALTDSEAAKTARPARKALGDQDEVKRTGVKSGQKVARNQARVTKSGVAGSATPFGPDTSRAAELAVRDRQEPRPEPDVAAEISAADTQANTESLRFNLQFYRINEQLAVVNEAPHQLRGKDNKNAVGLLKNILLALGADQQSASSLQADGFQWPIAEGLDAGNNPKHAAKLALQGFISQRHEQFGFRNLLLLTAQLSPIMTVAEGKQTLGDLKPEGSAYTVTLSHSLQAMLAHPELKREAWMHMQALRSRISPS
jgi:hypothetical protein